MKPAAEYYRCEYAAKASKIYKIKLIVVWQATQISDIECRKEVMN